ncbi:hypothetical protein HPO96_33585 [Kribbella sandramycini]|uniref:Uncharacterized protein n=1 Tax=Kribbella sandramycini TaxID=60450 RepID=A0A7Y4L891_9ACTN|nr:hypothetical protein [Kribbella sandramycini]MBB6570328.1 hypothetical protein [Kribbella sandramycini]NOL45192.1 hypothetical protein [Kribbella sandramycini]
MLPPANASATHRTTTLSLELTQSNHGQNRIAYSTFLPLRRRVRLTDKTGRAGSGDSPISFDAVIGAIVQLNRLDARRSLPASEYRSTARSLPTLIQMLLGRAGADGGKHPQL